MLQASGGVNSCLTANGMTRAPVVRFQSAQRASRVKQWMEHAHNFALVQEQFNSTSRYAACRSKNTDNLYVDFCNITFRPHKVGL